MGWAKRGGNDGMGLEMRQLRHRRVGLLLLFGAAAAAAVEVMVLVVHNYHGASDSWLE